MYFPLLALLSSLFRPPYHCNSFFTDVLCLPSPPHSQMILPRSKSDCVTSLLEAFWWLASASGQMWDPRSELWGRPSGIWARVPAPSLPSCTPQLSPGGNPLNHSNVPDTLLPQSLCAWCSRCLVALLQTPVCFPSSLTRALSTIVTFSVRRSLITLSAPLPSPLSPIKGRRNSKNFICDFYWDFRQQMWMTSKG